eukprot:9970340-Prorocentrum_lima.AAC.1
MQLDEQERDDDVVQASRDGVRVEQAESGDGAHHVHHFFKHGQAHGVARPDLRVDVMLPVRESVDLLKMPECIRRSAKDETMSHRQPKASYR